MFARILLPNDTGSTRYRDLRKSRRRDVSYREGFEEIKDLAAIATRQIIVASGRSKQSMAIVRAQRELGQSDNPVAEIEAQAQFKQEVGHGSICAAETEQATGKS